MNQPMGITRRDCVRYIAASATLGCAADRVAHAEEAVTRSGEPVQKQVAAVMTVYHKWSHPDVILGKIFEGWKQDGGPGSALQVVSMYVDQPVPNDLAQKMSAKHNVPIFDTIEKTVTVGGDRIPIDGVISLGEGGNYSANEKEQDLFPRRRFFEEITDTFVKCDRVVPVFNDKHLGPVWSDAKWMYDRALQLNIPFMAGSSLPVTFRTPEISVPIGCQIEGRSRSAIRDSIVMAVTRSKVFNVSSSGAREVKRVSAGCNACRAKPSGTRWTRASCERT